MDRTFIIHSCWCRFSILFRRIERIGHNAIEDFWLGDTAFLCLASFADYFLERILIGLENYLIILILISQSLEV